MLAYTRNPNSIPILETHSHKSILLTCNWLEIRLNLEFQKQPFNENHPLVSR